MHSDAQFAGSSSVTVHVEMMGFLGMGENSMVDASVALVLEQMLAKQRAFSRMSTFHPFRSLYLRLKSAKKVEQGCRG